jgi:uncharacterized Zn finger protein
MLGPGYRPDRLRRAWQLVKSGRVKPLGGTRFVVAGNVEKVYHVDLAGDPMCYCRDQEYRSGQIKGFCKHVGAAISEWIATQEREAQANRELTRQRRKSVATTTETHD